MPKVPTRLVQVVASVGVAFVGKEVYDKVQVEVGSKGQMVIKGRHRGAPHKRTVKGIGV